jgi:hypothetical protein
MGLETNDGSLLYLNIKNGKITYKKDGEKKETDAVSGIITALKFEDKEYEGNKYEQLALTIVDGGEKFILQMSTDSGYFNSFCNSLRTGDPTKRVKITPWLDVVKGKKKSGIFVEQFGKALKWFATKDKPMDVPPMESTVFDGKTLWSSKKQQAYWKNWLLSVKWEHEIVAGSLSQPTNTGASKSTASSETITDINPIEDNDDLPF